MALQVFPAHGWLPEHKLIKPQSNTIMIVDIPKLFNELYTLKNNNVKLIYLQCEPEAIVANEEFLLACGDFFNIILTFNQKVLDKYAHAYKYQPGESWIIQKDWISVDVSKKIFSISNLTGGKLMTPAHYFRQAIYNNQNLFCNIPITFYRSEIDLDKLLDIKQNPIIGRSRESKIDLFYKYQFHLAIENSRQINYFSEKLIDCLITKTIPIYYGCPNISEYFDTSGWIILESMDINELITKIKCIDTDYYIKHIDAIESNYIKVQQYSSLINTINSVLSKVSY